MSTLGSLFDGSGGFPLAGALSGITPLWASEIEPYPIAVTTSRFPQMKHLGNVAEVDGMKIPPVDIITFGSPCQDMSVAGKRVGMKHREKGDDATTRSGLFYEAIRIIREMRESNNGRYPTFAIWENVPGAFSSNGGEDFRCVLEELAKICGCGGTIPRPANGKWRHAGEIVGDGFSIAWRVLDAQYWGVPQRRKRIYLVADFAGGRAGKILFERESGGGNPEPGEEARQGAADHAAGCAGGSDRVECFTNRGYQCGDVEETCSAGAHGAIPMIAGFMGGQGSKAGGLGYAEEIAPTIKSVMSGGNTVPDVVYAINDKATRNRGGGSTRHDDGAGNGLGVQDDGAMYTLDTASRHAVCYPETARCLTARYDGSPCADRGQNVVCYAPVGNHCGSYEDSSVSATLQTKYHYGSGGDAAAVVYSSGAHGTLTEGVGTVGTGTRAVHEMVAVYDTRGNSDGSTVPTLTGDHQNRVTDYAAVCVGNGQLHNISMAEKMNTLDCMHDQQAVLTSGKPPRRYIVRRLTPLECCRLQGFPDGWGDTPCKDRLSDDEYEFWLAVRNTHASVNGKAIKNYTKDQMLKWYNGLHTDSAEYKMWGNGVALPCAYNVVSGCAEELRRT